MTLSSRIRLGAGAVVAAALTLTVAPAVSAAPAATSAVPSAAAVATAVPAESDDFFLVGHRGASGYRPEHTLASYRLAIGMGVDAIEPDLVSTKDGVLVARHENEISGTTDVAEHPEFADLRTTKTIDGVELTGWFTEDFTYRQLRSLRAVERLPDVRPDNTRYDGKFRVPTFDQVLDLAQSESERLGREIQVIPETKHPTYFDSIGLSLEEPMLRQIRLHDMGGANGGTIVQSFETTNLKWLASRTRLPLVQLVGTTGAPYDLVDAGSDTTYADIVTAAGLRAVARYATVLGPDTANLLPKDANGYLLPATNVVRDAHRAGLDVVPYTVRDENQFLPADFRSTGGPNAKGDVFGWYAALFDTGIDGIFADMPDSAVQALRFYQGDYSRLAS